MSAKKLLLLNASNMGSHPVYPYAFIQVPAVARRAGIEVVCEDFLGIPQADWGETIHGLVEANDPSMILITLRNTDSLNLEDYESEELDKDPNKSYFPVEQTRQLISTVRAVTDLKITLGGFGFSLLSEQIMSSLRPDFGVFGGADGFFTHFDDVRSGEYADVPNLMYYQDGQHISNSRIYYPPLAGTEYTPKVIQEMLAFYDAHPTPGFQGAPIEIIRGCPHACVFCAEPHVVGRQVRYRDISVVMADIKTLADHGIRQLYMISSELNPEGNEYLLKLAGRILSFNETQTAYKKITWFGANYLLNFSIDEYDLLYRSGFTGGWFDITALDDENARAMRTPYRNRSLITHLKTYVQAKETQYDQLKSQGSSQLEELKSEAVSNKNEHNIRWSMFLGNPATDMGTIRNTLRVANQEGLAQLFSNCSLFTNIRVFDYEAPDDVTLAATYSISTNLERTGYQQLLPSFAYPPKLLEEFGSEEEIKMLFRHLGDTYLSTKYQETRDWHSFLIQNTTLKLVTSWITELSSRNGIQIPPFLQADTGGESSLVLRRIFSGESQDHEEHAHEYLAEEVVSYLLTACLDAFPDHIRSLGFPATPDELEQMTPYELASIFYKRWSSEDEFALALSNQTRPEMSESMQEFVHFCVQAILYRFNVQIRAEYRSLFI